MSKKLLILLALLVMLAAGCSSSATTENSNMENMSKAQNASQESSQSGDQGNATPQAANSVEIKGYKFMPQSITVKKGTTVTWTNRDDAHHNVVAQGPNASTGPKSELLAKDQSYTYTFSTVGTYNYLCEPHPYMTGMVIVTE